MADQFLGEVRLVGFNFPPYQWAQAAGQLLPIAQYSALFSLLGTFFGGNGMSTFGLPNLQGNVAVGQGPAPGMNTYVIGETGGSATVTLIDSESPAHSHAFLADARPAGSPTPAGNSLGATAGSIYYSGPGATSVPMSPNFLSISGGSQPHNNMMPFLTLNWVIALQGIYPQRS